MRHAELAEEVKRLERELSEAKKLLGEMEKCMRRKTEQHIEALKAALHESDGPEATPLTSPGRTSELGGTLSAISLSKDDIEIQQMEMRAKSLDFDCIDTLRAPGSRFRSLPRKTKHKKDDFNRM